MTPVEGMEPGAVIAELVVLGGSVGLLVLGLFTSRERQWIVPLGSTLVLLAALVATALALSGPERLVFHGTYRVDALGTFASAVVLVVALLVVGLSFPVMRSHARETEYYVLLLFAVLGLMLLTAASDVMLLVVAYLLSSVPLYTLTAFRKDARGTEAAMKYLLMGALLGITMLYGLALLYGAGGATAYHELAQRLDTGVSSALAAGLAMALAGLIFKLGAVPGHFWVPDVAEGAPAPVAAFVTTAPKIAALAAVTRLLVDLGPEGLVDWRLPLALLAAATMTLGNLAALWQDSARRLLAYSTISQVGYMLMAVAVWDQADLARSALAYYLLAYAVMNVGAFAVVTALPAASSLAAYGGLFRQRPGLAVSLTVCLLSLVGIPPLAGFVAKLLVFTATWDGGFAWLTAIAAVNTVVSIAYYLRWLVPVFSGERPDEHEESGEVVRAAVGVAHVAAVATVVIGVAWRW